MSDLRELAGRATPDEPRVANGRQVIFGPIGDKSDWGGVHCPIINVANPADAEFIAAAANPQAILELLDERDRLRAALEQSLDAMDTVREGLNVKDISAIGVSAESILRHAARQARAALGPQP